MKQNGEVEPWTNKLITRSLLHENAHYYHQEKGRFKENKVSTPQEEQIMDEAADKDLAELVQKHPNLSNWLDKKVQHSTVRHTK